MRTSVLLLLISMSLYAATNARYVEFGPDEPETIPCTSCAGARCEGVRVCRYGTFSNEMCGDNTDCYMGPGEVCGETVRQLIGRCRPGLQCRCGLCVGHTLTDSFDIECREFVAGRRRRRHHHGEERQSVDVGHSPSSTK